MDETHTKKFSIDRTRPDVWTVTFNNPPINMLGDGEIRELYDLLPLIEGDEALKVLVFESADPEFFIAHYDSSRAARSPPSASSSINAGRHPWIDFVLGLAKAPVVSIAKVRGRARGVGNEFILACDLRFASREKARFGQPEVGLGVVPGGGALEWLPRLVGRSRALEIVLTADDIDADTAASYGMINRAVDDERLDAYVDALAARIASFDKQTLHVAKELINRTGIPQIEEILASSRAFFETLAWPDGRNRRSRFDTLGYRERSDFELNLGKLLAR